MSAEETIAQIAKETSACTRHSAHIVPTLSGTARQGKCAPYVICSPALRAGASVANQAVCTFGRTNGKFGRKK